MSPPQYLRRLRSPMPFSLLLALATLDLLNTMFYKPIPEPKETSSAFRTVLLQSTVTQVK